jgi:hypothetical protein
MNINKLNEDDIMEIVLEYFQNSDINAEYARGILLGTAGRDLRFVGLFGDENDQDIKGCDLVELDKNVDFNGDHSFLKNNPDFQIES